MDSSLFWCITGIIGGAIISFIISYFFYFKGLTRKRLTYDIKTFSIVSNKVNQIKGLEVKYNSTEIENLYASTITIKNIGNSVVKEQDLVPLCPISLSTSGQFLKAKMECVESKPSNKITKYDFSFQENNNIYNYIKFNFDYIPKKAIITYSVFHTGNITFNGDLIDGEIVTPSENQKQKRIKNILHNIITSIICAILASLISYFFFNTGGANH